MAERRMFAKTIVLSDAFLDMPMSARCLYFTLGMLGDDDGFINSPKSIMRQCGASEDDLRLLAANKFIIPFESGVIVIKHWRINNWLRRDRKIDTKYVDEMNQLAVDENGSYSQTYQVPTICQPSIVKDSIGKDSIGKDSIVKDSIDEEKNIEKKSSRFTPPTLEEVTNFCKENNYSIVPEKFIYHYESNGWMVGKTKMKSWKAAVRYWARTELPTKTKSNKSAAKKETSFDLDDSFVAATRKG
ncbi:MAG: replisome organizer [Clostridia bacterium]|nr:replisome organizer [Clostridia bacterium]